MVVETTKAISVVALVDGTRAGDGHLMKGQTMRVDVPGGRVELEYCDTAAAGTRFLHLRYLPIRAGLCTFQRTPPA